MSGNAVLHETCGLEARLDCERILFHSAQTSPSSPGVPPCLFLFQIALILTHDNEGSDTDREAFSLSHSHSLFPSVCLCLSLPVTI